MMDTSILEVLYVENVIVNVLHVPVLKVHVHNVLIVTEKIYLLVLVKANFMTMEADIASHAYILAKPVVLKQFV